MRKNGLAIFALLALLGMFGATRAYATAELKLDDGNGNTLDILDGSANDSCATANCVTYNGALGSWNINVTTGTSKDAATPALIDLNSVNHHSAGTSSTLTITFSDDGFTPGWPGFVFEVGGTVTAGGTVTFAAYDGVNKFDTTKQIGSTLSFNTSPYAGTTAGGGPSSNPYSLTEVATITFGSAAGTASFDAGINAVPEPASVALLGGVVLFAMNSFRRKARRA
jgi:hypothetical protein